MNTIEPRTIMTTGMKIALTVKDSIDPKPSKLENTSNFDRASEPMTINPVPIN
jgi:hypothetical protein